MALIGWYRCNDNAADKVVADASGNGYNGTSLRTTTAMAGVGKIGGALTFNATPDSITLPLSQAAGSFSVCAWFKQTAYTAYQFILDVQTGRGICTWDQNAKLSYYDKGSWREFGLTPADGTWHHVVWVCNAATGKVSCYLDGAQSGTDQTYTTIALGGTIALGDHYSLPGTYLKGLLDDVRIYSDALTLAQIQAIYNGGNGSDAAYPWLGLRRRLLLAGVPR